MFLLDQGLRLYTLTLIYNKPFTSASLQSLMSACVMEEEKEEEQDLIRCIGDPGRLRLSQGASLKADESSPLSPVVGQSDFARLGRLTTLLLRLDPR